MTRKRNLKRIESRKAEKRKKMLLKRRIKNMKIMIASSVVLITIICIVFTISILNNPDNYNKKNEPIQLSDIISETEVGIPISEIGNKASFYSYDANGIDVKYFAVKGTDGEVHVAFDACDVCYNMKMGYQHVGSNMKCINCGNIYSVNSLGTENTAGGCWPSFLPIKVDEGYVIINKSDLEQKRWMF
ncbi:MAG: DUF2318 domain-containing protein [Thermoplasmatales archaeon]|nr:MAG: DUF2318 domain-containing protein [Thermoplasmatales archaeon]